MRWQILPLAVLLATPLTVTGFVPASNVASRDGFAQAVEKLPRMEVARRQNAPVPGTTATDTEQKKKGFYKGTTRDVDLAYED